MVSYSHSKLELPEFFALHSLLSVVWGFPLQQGGLESDSRNQKHSGLPKSTPQIIPDHE